MVFYKELILTVIIGFFYSLYIYIYKLKKQTISTVKINYIYIYIYIYNIYTSFIIKLLIYFIILFYQCFLFNYFNFLLISLAYELGFVDTSFNYAFFPFNISS